MFLDSKMTFDVDADARREMDRGEPTPQTMKGSAGAQQPLAERSLQVFDPHEWDEPSLALVPAFFRASQLHPARQTRFLTRPVRCHLDRYAWIVPASDPVGVSSGLCFRLGPLHQPTKMSFCSLVV